MKATQGFIDIEDRQLFYTVQGEGPPLLLLHGWTQSSAVWSAFVPTLSKEFKVYSLDLHWHGRSSVLNSQFSIQQTALDLMAFLKALKLEYSYLMGFSFGALVVLQMAAYDSRNLRAMVLMAASAQYNGGENQELAASFSFENLPKDFIEALHELHPGGEEQLRPLFDPTLDYRIDLKKKDLNQIKIPTLILQGQKDEIFGVAPAKNLALNMPNAELITFSKAGHDLFQGNLKTRVLNESLIFLRKLRATNA